MNNITYIINADDFGRSPNINAAILQSFKNGWVSSATIMANMPGFDEACQIAREHNLIDCVGIHLVLSAGQPLTDAIKHQPRFCDENGLFRPKQKYDRIFHLNNSERRDISAEIAEQIKKCRKHGLRLTHLDSHHHYHEEWGVLKAIIPLMRGFGIPYIRIMGNVAESCSTSRRLYTILYNSYLKYHRLNRTHYFGSINQYIAFIKKSAAGLTAEKRFEIMTHPILNDEGIIVDALINRPIEELIKEAGLH